MWSVDIVKVQGLMFGICSSYPSRLLSFAGLRQKHVHIGNDQEWCVHYIAENFRMATQCPTFRHLQYEGNLYNKNDLQQGMAGLTYHPSLW